MGAFCIEAASELWDDVCQGRIKIVAPKRMQWFEGKQLWTMMNMNEAAAVFQIEQLKKTYLMGEVEVHALRGVDLQIHESEFAVLLGPSGSGKSTLLNILGGLDHPTSGTIHFRNLELSAASDRQLTQYRRMSVGFVFQFYNLIPSLTAYENVAIVTEISPSPMDPGEALDLVGLSDRKEHFPAQLSGGQQQRVAIARAIAKRPEVLLCDEPTGALDASTGVSVLDAIDRINRETKTTTIVITHNASIGEMADRVILMRDGKIASDRRIEVKKAVEQITW